MPQVTTILSDAVLHHRLQTSVLVFWVADQATTYPKLAQAFDYFNSDAPAIELQFLLRPNLTVLLWWRAHYAGWHHNPAWSV